MAFSHLRDPLGGAVGSFVTEPLTARAPGRAAPPPDSLAPPSKQLTDTTSLVLPSEDKKLEVKPHGTAFCLRFVNTPPFTLRNV